ncbi:hypothetical protein FB009_12446 [Sinorhizobium medicae]|uniref:hypothetical protein n=1 Tax=Sinorhizobium TaxID=28105 RepID=UPI000FD8ECF0|nr:MULTISPECIES: hypothetical protein [Sinorhizobium]MDX0567806.1 hypothetical protein [Sinorhizobium medicae]MDX0784088.1 hypothetical protein [Sinorhizobium medicae]MDX1083302.1 hypothetical protein [Sinorhizobium medicae]MQU73943.1 hypothetical protein [Sinorhizobium medicae]RVE78256.1 hypothetical protein CN238_34455 [Sinorhizobium meliloti]
MLPANPLRGEAEVRIGSIDFRIAVTFSGLARLSDAIGARTLDELYGRLLGFEPKAVACAVRCLIVADDEDHISALSAKILDDGNISAADQLAWREAVEKALSAHIAAGTIRRDERTASQIAGDAVLGKPVSPS